MTDTTTNTTFDPASWCERMEAADLYPMLNDDNDFTVVPNGEPSEEALALMWDASSWASDIDRIASIKTYLAATDRTAERYGVNLG